MLSPDLREELGDLAPPLDGVPTEAEIRVAQAQLVGWLEGLFHGIQAAMFAQQAAARQQFEELRRRGLPGQDQGMQGPTARRRTVRSAAASTSRARYSPGTSTVRTPTAPRSLAEPPPPASRCAM